MKPTGHPWSRHPPPSPGADQLPTTLGTPSSHAPHRKEVLRRCIRLADGQRGRSVQPRCCDDPAVFPERVSPRDRIAVGRLAIVACFARPWLDGAPSAAAPSVARNPGGRRAARIVRMAVHWSGPRVSRRNAAASRRVSELYVPAAARRGFCVAVMSGVWVSHKARRARRHREEGSRRSALNPQYHPLREGP